MIFQARVTCGLLCLILLAGCTVPISTNSTSFPNPTSIYQTVSVGLTQTVLPAPTAVNTRPGLQNPTPLPVSASVSPGLSTPTGSVQADQVETTAEPCDRASAGKPSIDVSVPDGARFTPGEPFSKVWRLVNTGSCTWTQGYSVVWFSGESFSSIRSQVFSVDVPTGHSADITVDMVAPDVPGIHQSNWKLSAPNGSLFGIGPNADAPFWVRIEVLDKAGTAVATQPVMTPTSEIAIRDTVILKLKDSLNLDIGKINSGPADDLGIVDVGKASAVLSPLNGARMGIFGSSRPVEADCRVASLSSDGISLIAIPENSFICYRTNQGLPGFGKLSNITEKSFSLDYTTWMVP